MIADNILWVCLSCGHCSTRFGELSCYRCGWQRPPIKDSITKETTVRINE